MSDISNVVQSVADKLVAKPARQMPVAMTPPAPVSITINTGPVSVIVSRVTYATGARVDLSTHATMAEANDAAAAACKGADPATYVSVRVGR